MAAKIVNGFGLAKMTTDASAKRSSKKCWWNNKAYYDDTIFRLNSRRRHHSGWIINKISAKVHTQWCFDEQYGYWWMQISCFQSGIPKLTW
jgi:hypothetical protein